MASVFPTGIDTFSTKVDRGIVYHTDMNALQDAIVALETFLQSDTQGLINVKSAEFGAVGDGVADDTAAIQAAIDAAKAVTFGSGTVTRGAVVFFPPGYYKITSTLDMDECRGVRLLGCNWHYGSSFWSASTLKFTQTTTAGIDLGSTDNSSITIEKLTLAGSQGGTGGADLNNNAIFGTSAAQFRALDLNIHGWGGSALRLNAGADFFGEHIQATGCMYGYGSLAAAQGVIHIGGGEAVMQHCNINGTFAFTTGNYTSGLYAAVYINGSPFRLHQVVAAFAEVGFHFGQSVTASPAQVTDCRGEFNQGHGFWTEGSDIHFQNCSAFGNGLAADATYSGFYTVKGASGFVIRNSFSNCVVSASSSVGGNSNHVLYGFTDNSSGAGNLPEYGNRYDINCRTGSNMAAGGRTFNFLGTIVPSWGGVPRTQTITGTGSQTFNGESGNIFRFSVNGNSHSTLAAGTIVPGQNYHVVISNDSGASPTIDIAATFLKAGYASPANGKYRTATFHATGTNTLVQVGDFSSDL